MEDSYFAQEHNFNQTNINKPKKKSVSIPTFIFSMIIVVCVVVIVFLKRDDILWFFGTEIEWEEIETSQSLSVWDEVEFSWVILSDIQENYTHIYFSDEYGRIWLRSNSIALNSYTWSVQFKWVVVKISHEIPVVNVTSIYNLETQEDEIIWDDVQTWDNTEIQSKYLPNLLLYFWEDFFEKYTLINEWDGSVIKMKNLETNIISSINYFKCNKNNNSENCDYLADMYKDSSTQKLIDRYGVSYYKDPEVNSWFFSNDSIFWYKILDESESFVTDLTRYMSVVNKSFVEKTVNQNISQLCKIDHTSISNIINSELLYKNNDLYYNLTWKDTNGNMISCELKINPTLKNSAQTINVKMIENTETISEWEWSWTATVPSWEEKTDSQNDKDESWENDWETAVNRDPNVEQFPINLDKKLTFTSSRGHSFVFPSSNIAYQWVSASEDFGQLWVNCFSAMNIVKYSDKELVETKWNVIIYECTVKNSFDDSDQSLIYKEIWDRHFVIKIVDPAWINFANNIEIKA